MLDTGEYSWPGLGGDPSGLKGDGGAWETGGGAAGSRRSLFGTADRSSVSRGKKQAFGSVNPTAIVGPAILATAVSTLAGVIFCKVMDGKRRA